MNKIEIEDIKTILEVECARLALERSETRMGSLERKVINDRLKRLKAHLEKDIPVIKVLFDRIEEIKSQRKTS